MNIQIPKKPTDSMLTDEQWLAVQAEPAGDILVSASAGSGKTRVLIERLMRKIIGGTDISNVLVVTFTEKAAQEMKDRLERQIEEKLAQIKRGGEAAGSPKLYQHLEEQLLHLPGAQISTIDAFCRQICQKFYYLSDFDPNYRLLTDETEKQMLYEDIFNRMQMTRLEEGEEDPNLALLMDNFAVRGQDKALLAVLIELYEKSRSHPKPGTWLDSLLQYYETAEHFSATPFYEEVLKPLLIERLTQLIEEIEAIKEQSLTGRIYQEYLDFIEISTLKDKYSPDLGIQEQRAYYLEVLLAVEKKDYDAVYHYLQEVQPPKIPTFPTKKNKAVSKELLASGQYQQMKAFYDEVRSQLQSKSKSHGGYIQPLWEQYIAPFVSFSPKTQLELLNSGGQMAEALVAVTQVFNQQVEQYFQEEKLADFQEVALRALEILSGGTGQRNEAREYYQNMFEEILVDEYQDVNQLQEELFQLLKNPEHNRLFMVGDVKQSIYGFRYAEPDLFIKKAQAFGTSLTGDLRIDLLENFRSRATVLETTNRLFAPLMSKDLGGITYDEKAALVPGATYYATDKNMYSEFLLLEEAKEKASERESAPQQSKVSRVEWQARAIAARIKEMLAAEQKIFDPSLKPGRFRPLKYSDIVILSRSRSGYEAVEQVFEEFNIPIRFDRSVSFYERSEIMIVVNCMKLIDNPKQDIPLVSVLRSPIVGLTEPELAKIRIHQPEGDYLDAVLAYQETGPDLSLRQTLQTFWKHLENWRQLSSQVRLAALLAKIYQDTGFLLYAAGMPNGEQRENNLRAFFQHAENFEALQYRGLFAFIRYIENIYHFDQDLDSPTLNEADANEVQMMTIHAAKGLEFPLVFYFQLEKSLDSQPKAPQLLVDNHLGLSVQINDQARQLRYLDPLGLVLKDQLRKEARAEELRLLYVALTRAEQKLILVGRVGELEQQKAAWLKAPVQFAEKAGQSFLSYYYRLQASNALTWFGSAIFHPHWPALTAEQWQVKSWSPEDITRTLQDANQQLAPSHCTQEEDALPVLSPLTFAYEHELATKTTSHQSVSELKRILEDPIEQEIESWESLEREQDHVPYRYSYQELVAPKFKTKQQRVQPSDIGSATHLLMQKISLAKTPQTADFIALADELVANGYIEKEVFKEIPFHACAAFFETHFGQYILAHKKQLVRERSFTMKFPAQEIFPVLNRNEELLIHGTIDGFIQDGTHLVLFDYKTDRIAYLPTEQQAQRLQDRYQLQMNLYAKALETVFQLPVQQKNIVSLDTMAVYPLP